MRIVVPRAPKLPITALGEMEERTWFDLQSDTLKQGDEEDARGIKQVCWTACRRLLTACAGRRCMPS